jgi:hypothetical protein
MPIKNVFSRRRSSGNALDIQPEQTTAKESSFKVLPRNDKPAYTVDARQRSAENLGFVNRSAKPSPLVPDWVLKRDRGSGGTTNSGSSGFYDSSSASARHSSSSTLPSSVDQERDPDDDELFPRKSKTTSMSRHGGTIAEEPLRPPTSFSARAARAFTVGNKHNRQDSEPKALPPVPVSNHAIASVPELPTNHQRNRSTTASSYASTAVPSKPAKVETNLNLSASFGDDFSNMFDGIGNRSREELSQPPPPAPGSFHRTVSRSKPAM